MGGYVWKAAWTSWLLVTVPWLLVTAARGNSGSVAHVDTGSSVDTHDDVSLHIDHGAGNSVDAHGDVSPHDGHGAGSSGDAQGDVSPHDGHGAGNSGDAHGDASHHDGHGAGAGHKVERYEHDFVESVCLIVILCLALVFETVWHHIGHKAQTSYMYGLLHESAKHHEDGPHLSDRERNVQHVNLMKELSTRAGGEFMVLGFTSFVIFVADEAGFFKWLTECLTSDPSGLHIPHTEKEWLHVAELVHVKLFLGMLVYFFFVFWISRGSVYKIKRWETARLRRAQEIHSGLDLSLAVDAVDEDMAEYLCWHEYMTEKTYGWKTSRPEAFKEIERRLGLNGSGDSSLEVFMEKFSDQFVLSAYLALNVGNAVCDAVVVHKMIWLFVMMLVSIIALLHWYLHVTLVVLTPIFTCVALLVLTVMWMVARRRKSKIVLSAEPLPMGPTRAMTPRDLEATIKRHAWRSWLRGLVRTKMMGLLRILQVVLFFISYTFSRTIADVEDWHHDTQTTALYSALLGLLIIVLGSVLSREVPMFLAVMSLPPFVDKEALEHLFAVIADNQLAGSTDFCKNAEAPMRGYVEKESHLEQLQQTAISLLRKIDAKSNQVDHQVQLESLVQRMCALEARMEGIDPDITPEMQTL